MQELVFIVKYYLKTVILNIHTSNGTTAHVRALASSHVGGFPVFEVCICE